MIAYVALEFVTQQPSADAQLPAIDAGRIDVEFF